MSATAGAVRAPVPTPRGRWWRARRTVQFGLLGLFLAGPWAGVWWVRGNLASSDWFGLVGFTDPFIALQSVVAGHAVAAPALLGAALVVAGYALLGGRSYCAWVCPVNIVTDAAAWSRDRLGIRTHWQPDRRLRIGVALAALGVSAVTGTIAWEFVNPITWLQRGLVFGMGAAWLVVAAVFAFDLLVTRRGWCSHVCPVGAFYGAVGVALVVRVRAERREACTDCGDCFRVCPEPHVIAPALKPRDAGAYRAITHGDCINCGACIDVCNDDVFEMGLRWRGRPRLSDKRSEKTSSGT
ncbi:MAG: quinol dehydrogenase ferredoxin subunit NapH [Burkholderiales bacterium]|nr:quinol dehydrogenase ferredoxin subunit NapH [Burkholderiales bacterium]